MAERLTLAQMDPSNMARAAEATDFGFAAQRGKTVLYKFRPYSTDQDRGRVREILAEHKVYFARASQLNDPFDLFPRIDIPSRGALIEGLQKHFERRTALSEDERRERMAHFQSVDLEEHQRHVEARIRRRLDEDYWVFSLAGNRDHPMLWSHYAGGHTGLCVHFRSDEGSLFSAAMAVEYAEERPVLPLDPGTLTIDELAKLTTLRKGKFWSYEEEFRFVRHPHVDYKDFPIRFEGQQAHFSSRELCGVSVGARMEPREVDEMCELATRHTPKLPVWCATEGLGFNFTFELIA